MCPILTVLSRGHMKRDDNGMSTVKVRNEALSSMLYLSSLWFAGKNICCTNNFTNCRNAKIYDLIEVDDEDTVGDGLE
jgi:hypothetical protein